MELLYSLLILILTLTYILYRKVFFYWESLGILQFPISNHRRGNLNGLGTKYHMSKLLENYYKKTKELGQTCCGLYMPFTRVLLVCDLDLAKRILIEDFSNFANHGTYCNEKDDPVSANLFNLQNERWSQMRRIVSPIFTSGKLKMMFETIEDVADKMMNKIDENRDIEIRKLFAKYSTDIVGSVVFGIDINSLDSEVNKFLEINSKLYGNSSSLKRAFRYAYPNLAKKLGMTSLPALVSEFYLNITKQSVEFRENNTSFVRNDFLNLLIELKKQSLITNEQIAAQSLVFYIAG
jgi:cytochrome P450 family 6